MSVLFTHLFIHACFWTDIDALDSEKEEIELQLRAVPEIERRIQELEAVMAERR